MQNITVRRYDCPRILGYSGYLEPEDRSWIAFVDLRGRPRFFLHRDADTGAVLPDDQADRAGAVEAILDEKARRAAFTEPVAGAVYPVFVGETFLGRPQPPAPQGSSDGVFAAPVGEVSEIEALRRALRLALDIGRESVAELDDEDRAAWAHCERIASAASATRPNLNG